MHLIAEFQNSEEDEVEEAAVDAEVVEVVSWWNFCSIFWYLHWFYSSLQAAEVDLAAVEEVICLYEMLNHLRYSKFIYSRRRRSWWWRWTRWIRSWRSRRESNESYQTLNKFTHYQLHFIAWRRRPRRTSWQRRSRSSRWTRWSKNCCHWTTQTRGSVRRSRQGRFISHIELCSWIRGLWREEDFCWCKLTCLMIFDFKFALWWHVPRGLTRSWYRTSKIRFWFSSELDRLRQQTCQTLTENFWLTKCPSNFISPSLITNFISL